MRLHLLIPVILLLGLVLLTPLKPIADTGVIGPGIDLNNPDFSIIEYDIYNMPIITYIKVPANDTYLFYIGWGITQVFPSSDGVVDSELRIELTTINGIHVSSWGYQLTNDILNKEIQYHVEYVMGVENLTAGDYIIKIYVVGNDYVKVALGFWDIDKDPNTTTYAYINNQLTQIGDLGWYALTYDAYQSSSPRATLITPPYINNGKVVVGIELSNFKPNSEVDVMVVDQWATSYQIKTVNVDANGYFKGNVEFNLIKTNDTIRVRGYDVYGNMITIDLMVANRDYIPESWLSVLYKWFSVLFSTAELLYKTLIIMVPYLPGIYIISLASAILESVDRVSLTPLHDFFYKQYTALTGIVNVAVKIAEKIYEGVSRFISWLVEVLAMIIAI